MMPSGLLLLAFWHDIRMLSREHGLARMGNWPIKELDIILELSRDFHQVFKFLAYYFY
jgi:hypothetical protein